MTDYFEGYTEADWILKAKQLHESSNSHAAAVAESFKRSDTDGCVSQWASGITAQLTRAQACIAEQQGLAQFTGLYRGSKRVCAQLLPGKFGPYWLLHESEAELIAQRGKPFIPAGQKSRVQGQLGLSERPEMAPAWATTAGSGHGLAGAHTVHVKVFRRGDRWGKDAQLVE